jgi:tetratricopeptide (TPR) repeat protein
MVPFRRNLQFVGRQHEIKQLEELFSTPDGPRELAITGLGGVGKTQVALELAYRMRDRDSECSIFWIPCTSHESVEQAYMSIAQAVGIQDVKPTEAKEQVKNYLSQKNTGKWLLIFDSADDMEMWIQDNNDIPALKNSLPESKQGHILFTTRNHKLAVDLAGPYVTSIPELDEETGVEFLEKLLMQKDLLNDSDAVIAILTQLTFLPLAITQAVAYINRNRIGLSDYISLLQEQESEIVELLSENFQDKWRYKDIQNPVATTWLISFQQIQHLDELAADYLSFMACINPRNIPQSFLPQSTSKKKRTDAIGLLKAYSFINEQAEDHFLGLHQLVHLATRNWMRNNHKFTQWVFKTADRLNEVFPYVDHANRQEWREYLPHALLLTGESEFQMQQEKYINLVQKVSRCLYRDGRYNEAEMLLDNTMSIQQRKDGDINPDTLASMDILASIYSKQGRWKEAEELEVQIIKTQKQVLGPHPNTLISMGNLASIYRKQGRWKEAEELEVQVMEASKQVLGPKHPNTLISMGNLASIYLKQGRWKEAEELEVQIMEASKQVLGPEHPHTLISMGNLASIYLKQGRWKEAEELEVQVMEASKQVPGPKHPHTLTSMGNLASTYLKQGRWKEAEELEVQVMEVSKQVIGPTHPHTLISMNNLASTYRKQGRWKEAEELEVQVIKTQKQVLGPEHPDTLTSMANLALTYLDQGQWKEAENLGLQVMETRKQVLGPRHPETLTSMANLASIYRKQGRWKEAEELEVQVIKTQKQVLGPRHPETLTSMANLALTYSDQGRWKEAEKLGLQVMETRKQVLGPGHPETLTSMQTLSHIWKSLGNLEDALILMSKCVQLRSKELGSEHLDTLSASKTLIQWQQVDRSSPNKTPQALVQPERGQHPLHISERLPDVSIASRPSDKRASETSKSESPTNRKRWILEHFFRR